ncbi:MAG: Coenzyme F420 hydrogenase/dehydrogenase, beta subunit C-terminal domain [Ruminococcus flavefaciens]|nr:Coenzyme F420 hydrogenase/dehydrogenase, beta subunit C-terminal domain [Ruminococcus flavefaciens]
MDDLYQMQGSKYVQSNMGECYSKMIRALKQGQKVLFSGTPCQVTAAHNIALQLEKGKYRKNLITIGVLCHGVASPKVWESYKIWLEKQYNSKLIRVNFRDKSMEGYKKSYCRYEFESGEIVCFPTYLPSSKFIEATLVYNLGIRKSCAYCDCKGITSACDIILGDWYEACHGEGELGTSCIIAFTELGKQIVENSLQHLHIVSFSNIVDKNKSITDSAGLGSKREQFFSNLNDDIWNNVEKYYPSKYVLKKFLVKIGLYESYKNIAAIIRK